MTACWDYAHVFYHSYPSQAYPIEKPEPHPIGFQILIQNKWFITRCFAVLHVSTHIHTIDRIIIIIIFIIIIHSTKLNPTHCNTCTSIIIINLTNAQYEINQRSTPREMTACWQRNLSMLPYGLTDISGPVITQCDAMETYCALQAHCEGNRRFTDNHKGSVNVFFVV